MTMSSPPEYHSISQHDEDESYSPSKPLYPPPSGTPPPGEGSGMQRDDDGELITITYTFKPRYPVTGSKQHAVGVVYADKMKTTAAVRRLFAPLQEYDLDRIEILAPVRISGEEHWALVSEEAWKDRILKDQPSRLKVQVADGPGDAQARRQRLGCILVSSIGGGILAALFVFGLLAAIVSKARHG